MKHIIYLFFLFLLFSCETKYNNIDTGIANGNHNCNMMEYFATDSYDWDSTVLMIRRAGLEDVFEGKREGYEHITFFGPTNHSIRLWMLENDYKTVNSIPTDICHDMIMRSVVTGLWMRDDFPRGVIGTSIPGEGGITLTGGIGNRFWIFSKKEPYHSVPEGGPVVLYIQSYSSRLQINIASTNIQTLTGVVHSLDYAYQLGTL